MKTGWIAGAVLVVLFGCHGTFAETCVITNRQTYNLAADTVNWSMRVGNGQNCRYGVRYAKVQFEKMTLAAPPRSGRVVLEGSAFTYVPRKDFQGDDSFDLEIAGQIQKVRGASTIHIVVSVRSATKSAEPVRAAAPAPTVSADTAGRTVPVPRSSGPTPPIMAGHGPAPVPTPPAPGAAPGPVPQLGLGPAPMPMLPQSGGAPAPMPPVPTASSTAPSSLPISPARSP
jgi:hypothetical protein